MSEFTEKSDFYDFCNVKYSPQEVVKNMDIYVCEAKINVRSEIDLIPYYTHSVKNAEYISDSKQIIYLSDESEINREEKISIGLRVLDCLEWKKLADESNEIFNLDFIKKQKNYWDLNEDIYKKIIMIMNEDTDCEISHFVFPKSWKNKECIFVNYFIPTYFSKVHLDNFTKLRENFIKYALKNKYKIFGLNTECYSPILFNMYQQVQEFNEMEKKICLRCS